MKMVKGIVYEILYKNTGKFTKKINMIKKKTKDKSLYIISNS